MSEAVFIGFQGAPKQECLADKLTEASSMPIGSRTLATLGEPIYGGNRYSPSGEPSELCYQCGRCGLTLTVRSPEIHREDEPPYYATVRDVESLINTDTSDCQKIRKTFGPKNRSTGPRSTFS